MADNKVKDALNTTNANGNAPGGRGIGLGEIGSGIGPLAATAEKKPTTTNKKGDNKDEEELDEGFGIEHSDVKGSLKVHIKLDLEADIRIIARIKGDIAIGLL